MITRFNFLAFLCCLLFSSTSSQWVNPFGTGLNNNVRCFFKNSSLLYVGGEFTTVSGSNVNYIARFDTITSTWTSIGASYAIHAIHSIGNDLYVGGTGGAAKLNPQTLAWSNPFGAAIGNAVYALHSIGTDLYLGGTFTNAGGVGAKGIAKFNTLTSTWSNPFGTTVTGWVRSITSIGTDLYVGGPFSTSTGSANVGKFDTLTSTWSTSLPSVFNNYVYEVHVLGTDLYVAGEFSTLTGIGSVGRIAKFNTLTSTWSNPFGTGLSGPIYKMLLSGNDLYIGGQFATANGISSNNIAKVNLLTFAWDYSFGTGTNGYVHAFATIGTDLIVGGAFTTAGLITANRIAEFSNIVQISTPIPTPAPAPVANLQWSNPFNTGVNKVIRTIYRNGTLLYVGGDFTSASGATLLYVGVFNTLTSTWSQLGAENLPFSSSIHGITSVGTNLYVCGAYLSYGIMKLTTTTGLWSAIGGPIGTIQVMQSIGTDLYVGGTFSLGGTSALAKYDTLTGSWTSSIGGMTMSGLVRAMASNGTDLFVGGDLRYSSISKIARFSTSTSTWTFLDSNSPWGFNSAVHEIQIIRNALYVGGGFTLFTSNTQGALAYNRLAKYEGSSWSNVFGSGLDGSVYRMHSIGNDLYVGGQFNTANGVSSKNIAKFDTLTSTWSYPFGTGANDYVYAFNSIGSDLYVGGGFTSVNGISANRIAKFSSFAPTPPTPIPTNSPTPSTTPAPTPACVLTWTNPFGVGLNSTVRAIESVGNTLYVGGEFTGNLRSFNTESSSWASIGTKAPLANWNINVNSLLVIGSYIYFAGDRDGNSNAIGRITTSGTESTRLSPYYYFSSIMYAVHSVGSNIYFGGAKIRNNAESFSSIMLQYNGTEFTSFITDNENSIIRAFASSGTSLFVAGYFKRYGAAFEYLAILDTPSGNWISLPGPNAIIYDVIVLGSDLYIGGDFTSISGVGSVGYIAKYDLIESQWSNPFGTGLSGSVYKLHAVGNDLYVGGQFATANGVSSKNIAKFDTLTKTWSYPFGTGANAYVQAIANVGSDLYVGGAFTSVNGVSANRIAKFSCQYCISSSTYFSNAPSTPNLNQVYSSVMFNNFLYVGGSFSIASPVFNNIARYSPTLITWSTIVGFNGAVNALCVYNGGLAATGQFTQTQTGLSRSKIAVYISSTNTWNALGTGLNGDGYALAAFGTKLFVGGAFTLAGGAANTSYVAQWDGSAWSRLRPSGPNGIIRALAIYDSSYLIIGGSFTLVGTGAFNRIVKWPLNGSFYESVGNGLNGDINAICVTGKKVWVGGDFTGDGSQTLNKIALATNAASFSAIGSGVNGEVLSCGTDSATNVPNVYWGGSFTQAGTLSSSRAVKYNPTSNKFSAIPGNGFDGDVRTISQSESSLKLWFGGLFDRADFLCTNGLTMLNTASIPNNADEDVLLSASEIEEQNNTLTIAIVIAILVVLICAVCLVFIVWKRKDGMYHFHHGHDPEHHIIKAELEMKEKAKREKQAQKNGVALEQTPNTETKHKH